MVLRAEDRGRGALAVLLVIVAFGAAGIACKKPKRNLAELFDGGGSAAPIPSASVATTAPPVSVATTAPPADAGSDAGARAAELASAKDWLADLEWCVAHKATMNPANAGEGDASTECESVAAARPKAVDADVARRLDDAAALCAFDIPLVTANEALDQLRNSTSQASHLLMCTVATKEIAKAKAVHPRDARVARAEARRSGLCR